MTPLSSPPAGRCGFQCAAHRRRALTADGQHAGTDPPRPRRCPADYRADQVDSPTRRAGAPLHSGLTAPAVRTVEKPASHHQQRDRGDTAEGTRVRQAALRFRGRSRWAARSSLTVLDAEVQWPPRTEIAAQEAMAPVTEPHERSVANVVHRGRGRALASTPRVRTQRRDMRTATVPSFTADHRRSPNAISA